MNLSYISKFIFLVLVVVLTTVTLLPSRAQDSVDSAYKHYHKGNHKAAVQILSKAVKGKHARNAKAHYYLGNAWMKLGRPDYAKHCYRQSLKLKPSQPLAGYCIAALRSVSGPRTGSGKGIIAIGVRSNQIYKVQEGSSAARAGIKVGDKINAIDGKSTYGLKLEAIAKLLTAGPPGSRVALTLNRKGKIIKTVVTRQRPADPSKVGVVKVASSRGQSRRATVNLSAKDRSLIEIHKNKKTKNTDFVYNEVAQALSYLSDSTKDVLRNGGCKILIAPTILAACPELRSVKPGGYLHGGSYHNCPGMFMPTRKILYIAETASWRNSPPQLNRWAIGTTLHELGHAYDHCKGNLSDSPTFKKASKKDHQKLTNTTREQYWYYTQERRGDSELFAEIFAVVHGKGGLDAKANRMPSVFPNTTKFMKNTVGI